ncbi:MAG: carboxylesterase/lipase family protein, partial [Alphaproteobacteria bacterium]|nr:carboxylesterase/lipase family protein [Alphaproteobacteria bacterium]
MTFMGALNRRQMMAAGGSAVALAALPRIAHSDEGPVLTTTYGKLRGTTDNGIAVFKGVRYARPPLGRLRFKPPRRPKAWDGVVDATAFGAPAVQMPDGPARNPPRTELAKALESIFPIAEDFRDGREDCLFLNVWTPGIADGKKRPIMVWFHGGGFAYGSGAWPMYDGANLARKGDVVVVTLNHRLNAFGYLELSKIFGTEYSASGNAGMLDLVAALEWVHDNAAAIGGDAGNVTIFGESGGGAKVSYLMAMPAAKGLFHKAIVESGPGLDAVPLGTATDDAKALLAELKVSEPAQLQALPALAIIKAAYAVVAREPRPFGMRFLAPVVDGSVLPAQPFDPAAPALSASVPLIIGTNKDEMTLFLAGQPWFGKLTEAQFEARAGQQLGAKAPAVIAALKASFPHYSPSYLAAELATITFMWGNSIKLAERKAAQRAPVYMYQLTFETPVGHGILKTPHTLEMPFVFDNVERSRALVGPGPAPQRLADQMSAAWLAFAHSGNPNVADIP